MLVRDLFIAAMEIIGATTLDEVPEASEMQKCLRHANLMLDSWGARRLLQLATVHESFPLVANKNSYTIGVGANFNTAKPQKIVGAFVRDSGGMDYPVNVIPRELYDSYSDKNISQARPEELTYDPGDTQQSVQTGTIYVYPVPNDSSDTLFINSQKDFTEFVNLTDNVTFVPAYYKAIVTNLAKAIWRPMGRTGPVPPDISYDARTSLSVIENMNSHQIIAGLDVPTAKVGGGYNIYTDQG